MKNNFIKKDSIIIKNNRAYFDYEIFEKLECGVVLTGSEVKSLRLKKVSISESFISQIKGELYLLNSNISTYDKASNLNHTPNRPRKILMKRRQIIKFLTICKLKGLHIIPLSIYLNEKGIIKIEIALSKRKKNIDKREVIKKREWEIDKKKYLTTY